MARRALGPNARAILEGIRNDNKDTERYAAGVGDDCDIGVCPCCDSSNRKVEHVYGSTMGVRCACGAYDIVERPKRVRGSAM